MRMRTVKTICLAALVAGCLNVVVTGCATTSGVEASGKIVENNHKTEFNKSVIINNRGLAGDIEIVDMRSAFVGGMMKVQVSLRSNARETVPVQYKFVWFDAQGFEINANQAWKPFLVYGKETKTIQGVAPDARAKEFKLKMRDPDSVEDN